MAPLALLRDLFSGVSLLWQTRIGAYWLGMDAVAHFGAVLCLDDGEDLDLISQQTGVPFFSRERAEGFRRAFGDEPETYLLPPQELERLIQHIKYSPVASWIAVSPYPALSLARFAAEAGVPCFCRSWEEFLRFSSKTALRTCLEELDLPRLPGFYLPLRQARYSELASELGAKFVVQKDNSAAGHGTAVIRSGEDLAAAGRLLGDAFIWAASWAGSLSFNVNAVATGQGVLVGFPSVQIVGQPVLCGAPCGHGGNDFTAARQTPHEILTDIREQTRRIGGWIEVRGYRGLFGLDFVLEETSGRPVAVDLNPRWQGSTSLQSQAEIRQARIPLAAVELALRTGRLQPSEAFRMADLFFEPLVGSQVFPKAPAGGCWKASGTLEAGIHSASLQYRRPGLHLHELEGEDEVVITGGVPRPGRPMASGVALLRICSLRQSVDAANGRLLPWMEETVRQAYSHMALEPAQVP